VLLKAGHNVDVILNPQANLQNFAYPENQLGCRKCAFVPQHDTFYTSAGDYAGCSAQVLAKAVTVSVARWRSWSPSTSTD
jgi:hypothetical protein